MYLNIAAEVPKRARGRNRFIGRIKNRLSKSSSSHSMGNQSVASDTGKMSLFCQW